MQQPGAEQGTDHRAGAVLHHQQGVEAVALVWPGQLHDQCRARRIEQRAAQPGEHAGGDQPPRRAGVGHHREAGGAQQHAADDQRLGAVAVGQRATEQAQALLQQLADGQRHPDQRGGPAEPVDKVQADQRKDDEEAHHHQQVVGHDEPSAVTAGLFRAGHDRLSAGLITAFSACFSYY
ncbi:hypothetical protein D3C72_1496280 [compost metagenome]